MIILERGNPKNIYFSELLTGSVFTCDGLIYIKIQAVGDKLHNCISISNNYCCLSICDSSIDVVYYPNATLVLGDPLENE